ncbi:MAG: carbohydrate ABC transporter permease [Acutalibacteraceae bacterium]|nr:carbohydrate ABC transporter permease [Acutalibacteraceae bacterium]
MKNKTVNYSLIKKRAVMTAYAIFRFILIFGLAFIILQPLITKILLSFMSPEDLLDSTVQLIPKNFCVHFYKTAIEMLYLPDSFINTFIMSLSISVIQVVSCTMIGYGLGRFRFRGHMLAFAFVIIALIIPYQIISIPQYLGFANFRIGPFVLNLTDSFVPLFILAFTGLGVKEGLYIYLMKETFEALPKDLEDASYIDGAGTLKTFIRIMIPNAKAMIITVFLFSFCWQWTDTSYSTLYLIDKKIFANAIYNVKVRIGVSVDDTSTFIARCAASVLIMIPLIILFTFCQKYFVKSISRTGLAN